MKTKKWLNDLIEAKIPESWHTSINFLADLYFDEESKKQDFKRDMAVLALLHFTEELDSFKPFLKLHDPMVVWAVQEMGS